MTPVTSICFVCIGNIVRSPLAKSLFNYHAAQRGVGEKYYADAAGMTEWHRGEPPDLRMRRVAAKHGVPHEHRARGLRREDLDRFDLIVVMDEDNYDDIRYMDPTAEQLAKVHFLREYDPEGEPREAVPDPYYGGENGFEIVFEVIDRSVQGLLGALENQTTDEHQ